MADIAPKIPPAIAQAIATADESKPNSISKISIITEIKIDITTTFM